MISIIIPVYNVEHYLKQCLDSCFLQNYSDIEVLAINDGSKDNCGEILDLYAINELRLRVFHQPNQGVVAARNVGIENAKGDWIMFVDSDDYITNDSVETLYNLAIKTDSDIVSAGMYLLWKDGTTRITTQPNNIFNKESYFKALMRNEIIWGPCCKLFKRNLFNKIPSIPNDIKIGEDLMMNLFLATKANKIVSVNKQVYYYRKLSNSTVYNIKYDTAYWDNYITYLTESLKSQNFDIIRYPDALINLKILVSFNIISGGMKITDKYWVKSILDNSKNINGLGIKEKITLILLRLGWLAAPFYILYKTIILRKL